MRMIFIDTEIILNPRRVLVGAILALCANAFPQSWSPGNGNYFLAPVTAKMGLNLPTTTTAAGMQRISIGIGTGLTEWIFGQYQGAPTSSAVGSLKIGAGVFAGGTAPSYWAGLDARQSLNGTTTETQLGFVTSSGITSTERMTILPNGRVGIGTKNPSSTLEIAGSGASDGAIRASQGYFEIDGLNGAAGVNGGTNNFRLGFPVSGKLGFNLQGLERFTIMTNGNIGVNVPNIHGGVPVSAFEVNGSAVEGGGIRIQNGYFEADGVDAASASNGGTNNLRIGWPASGRVAFNLQGSEVMTMQTSGRVGVGTANPGAKLEVAGGGGADGALRVSQGFVEVDGINPSASVNGGTNNFRIGFPVSGKLGFNLQGIERFTMMTNGNVGVNVSGIHGGVPAAAFEVNGNAVDGGAIRVQNGYFEADGIDAAAASSGGTNNLRIGWPVGGRVGINLQGAEVMSFTTTGQVGIGKTAPSAALHVSKLNGTGQSAGLILENETSNGYGSALIFNARNASDQTVEMARIVGEGKSALLRFYTRDAGGTSQERMTIDQGGQVTVAGAISAGSIITKVWSVAPDYVFGKDYKLAPLERVEKFVNEKKHLPDIPSAKEIRDQGMDLAEMNLKLLKKVEELTLYLIEQKNCNTQQSNQIAKLSEEVSALRALVKR